MIDSTSVTIAEVEYMKTIAYAILPICLVICSLIGWKIYTCIFKIKVEERRAMTVGSIVLLLYLIYPSITSRTLALWKCEEIEYVGNIFIIDPETLCDDKIHQTYQHTLGIGCILCYVIGLPLFGVAVLYKFRNKLDERRTRVRFGLLYDGFVREHYMHEIWVVLRKFLLIVIGIFTDKLQDIFVRYCWFFTCAYGMESAIYNKRFNSFRNFIIFMFLFNLMGWWYICCIS